jgi:hypothetical protein
MRSATTLCPALVLVGLMISRAALADVLPPDAAVCESKRVGDACEATMNMGGSSFTGVCVESTCYRGPNSSPYSCRRCVPSDAAVPVVEAGTAGSSGAAGSPGAAGSAAVPPSPTPSTSDDSSGCAVGGLNATKAFGPWMLAGCVSALLFLVGRRRRR